MIRRLLVALSLLLAFGAQAQFTPGTKVGVFPGRLPPNIVSPPAQSGLSAPWQQQTFGGASAGNATSSSNVLTDVCFGQVGFSADAGHLVYQSLSGDQEMVGKLSSITADTVWARFAPQVRQSNAAGSVYFGLFFDHRNFVSANWRLSLNAHNDYTGIDTPWTGPQWWRIVRSGSTFSGYLGSSSTGPWTLIGSQAVTMSDPVLWTVMCENGGDPNPATQVSDLPSVQSAAGGGAGTVQFTSGDQIITEADGTITISLSRVGGSTGSGSVQIAVAGTSTAAAGTDYTTFGAPVTKSWSTGDAANKTQNITITNRAGTQSPRHLDLTLQSASGVTIGTPSTKVITINDTSAGANVKWRTGWYFDCYAEEVAHGDIRIALGNNVYTQIKNCIDYAATQTNVKGVFIEAGWTSFEGRTLGSFDGSVGNGLAVAGKIGKPLWDDIINYLRSKNLHLILGFQFYGVYEGPCGSTSSDTVVPPDSSFPDYLIQTSCTHGTDASNTYGYSSLGSLPYPRLWKSAVMDRMLAIGQYLCSLYDNDSVLEELSFIQQDGSIGGTPSPADGFSQSALMTQIARIPAALRPSCPHTNLSIENNWLTPAVMTAMGNSSNFFVVGANNSVVWQTTYGECEYLGLGTNSDGVACGSHNYQPEVPFTLWTPGPELCDNWDSKPSADAANNYTPTDFYNAYFSTGKTDYGSGHLLKPSHWIVGRAAGQTYCPGVASQQWGSPGSGGWYDAVQAHPTLNSTCPTLYPGCNTTP